MMVHKGSKVIKVVVETEDFQVDKVDKEVKVSKVIKDQLEI
jgi:hypothetical protein